MYAKTWTTTHQQRHGDEDYFMRYFVPLSESNVKMNDKLEINFKEMVVI
jgi:hypothetical protein